MGCREEGDCLLENRLLGFKLFAVNLFALKQVC
jgi:hypothetical protein